MKEKEIEDLRVIRVFDDGSNALSEMMNYLDGINHSNMCLEVTEKDVLMNVANLVCNFMLLHEAGEISKDDLDLYLGKKDYLANAHPLVFNFLFQSSINGRIYTNRPYYLDDLDE